MKTNKSEIIFGLLKVFYPIIWSIGGFMVLLVLAFSNGLISDYLGFKTDLYFLFIGLFFAFSFIWFKVFKKRWFKYLCSYLLTIIYFTTTVVLLNSASNYFHIFTKEKWENYINQRSLMIEDLKNNHNIIGMNEVEVIELLGEPNNRNEEKFAYYSHVEYKDQVYIEIYFSEEGYVIKIESIYML